MAPLAIIAAVVGLVWALIYFRQTGLMGACIAAILLGSCFGHPFFNQGFLTSDRVFVALLIVAYLAMRWHRWLEPKSLSRVDWLLLAFFAVMVLNTFTHDFQANESRPVATLVIFYAMPVAMYFIAREVPVGERNLAWLVNFLIIFGVYLAATGLAEYFQVWSLVFPTYIASPEHAEFLGRARGPFLNPCANGLFLAAGLAAALLKWRSVRTLGKTFLLGAIALLAAGTYATLTRSVWIGTGLVAMFVGAVQAPKQWRLPMTAGVSILAVLLAVAKWQDAQAFKRDKNVSVKDMAQSASLRPMLASIAWQMFQERPLFGCGFGNYLTEVQSEFSERFSDLPVHKAKGYVQHNLFLSLLTETGLVGLVLFMAVLLAWGHTGWQVWSNADSPLVARQQGLLLLALLIAYVVSGMFHDMAIIAMVHMLVFFQAGVVRGLAPFPATALAGAK